MSVIIVSTVKILKAPYYPLISLIRLFFVRPVSAGFKIPHFFVNPFETHNGFVNKPCDKMDFREMFSTNIYGRVQIPVRRFNIKTSQTALRVAGLRSHSIGDEVYIVRLPYRLRQFSSSNDPQA
jgi:hypothetical protein